MGESITVVREYNGINLNMFSIIFAISYVILSPPEVSARGRLMEPTQRSSLWTRGFDSPINDDDTGLNCGGKWVQHGINNGKCGVCGDRYDVTPRENEPGGTYANGIISNTYTTEDQSIPVVVDIQTAQGGYFEFRICPHNSPHTSASQECLDRHLLRVWDLIDKEPKYRYSPKRIGLHRLRVEIPPGMTCTQCVLQWKWRTAKDWGQCPDGNARLGCGPQEEFYNCADISIEQASPSNQRLVLPDVKNANRPTGFEMQVPKFDGKNVFSNIPMSFLPQEILRAGNIGPVIPPKFDFFDPNALNAQAQTTKQPEVTSVAKETSQAQDVPSNYENVVELKFNKNTGLETGNMQSTSDSAITYQSTGSSSQSNADISITSLEPTVGTSTEPKPTIAAFTESTTDQSQDVPSSSASLSSSTADQPMTSTSAQEQSTSGQTEPSTSRGGIAIPTFALGDLDTGGMLVKVGMGAQTTQDTPLVTSTTNSAQDSTTMVDQAAASSTDGQISTASAPTSSSAATTPTEPSPTRPEKELAPVPPMLRAQASPPARVMADGSMGRLSRRKRQAGPPPPPMSGPNAPPPSAANIPGPDYAQNARGPNTGTVSFGGLIGDSFSRGSSQTQRTFMSAQDVQQSMGSSRSIPGEALAETPRPGTVDMQGYPPDMMLAPGPQGPGSGLSEAMFFDPSLPTGESLLGAPIDADPSTFAKPGIPPPPKQSTAELEAAIVGAPQLSSAVSDTHISTDAADLVGATYIAELSEGRSNQAETSTAARHGTMIIQGEQPSTSGGRKVEYLSGSKGTSMRETAADTQAEIRSATMSLARFGYQPTAEQVLSGNIGIHHPTENLDTTNLEPIGPSPIDTANAAAPGILSAILGGQSSQVTDASLDPAVQKTREDLIRQLGEAMGVIGTNSASTAAADTSGIPVGGLSAQTQESPVAMGQQQIVGTLGTQQVVDTGIMGTGLDGGIGIDLQRLDMQAMDLQSLFGAADAAVNSQTGVATNAAAEQRVSQQTVVDAGFEQSMFGDGTGSQNIPTSTAAQTQPQQPQTPLDLVDIGMPGMTIEELMTLLNMEQGGAAASSSTGNSLSATSTSNIGAAATGAVDMESAMTGGSLTSSTSTSGSSSSSSSSSSGSVSSGTSNAASDKLIGLTAQSLNEMSTSSLEALLQEVTGGSSNPPSSSSATGTSSQSTSATSSDTSSSQSASSSSVVSSPDALLTAPLEKLSTSELEALLSSTATEPTAASATQAPEPTIPPSSATQSTAESRETALIKSALRRAVFDATGTEFDFSQMTQAELNDMVQMLGGLENLQQYMTPEVTAPEPLVPAQPVDVPITPEPVQQAPVSQQQTQAQDIASGNAAVAGLDMTNMDFATMQQFLNPSVFGNFGFGQQTSQQDMAAMMSLLNPTTGHQPDTISLADILGGNVNLGGQTPAQSSISGAQNANDVAQGAQTAAVNDFGMTLDSASTGSTASETSITGSTSVTAQGEITGRENMIYDPVQMQWITPTGAIVKDTPAAAQSEVQGSASSVTNQATETVTGTQEQAIANEQLASTSSSSSSSSLTTRISDLESAMTDTLSALNASETSGVDSSSAILTDVSVPQLTPLVGGTDAAVASSGTVDTAADTAVVDTQSAVDVKSQSIGIAEAGLSDLIPVGEQIQAQMTEQASLSTANVDPSPTVSTAGSGVAQVRQPTTAVPSVEAPRAPVGQPNQQEIILLNHEMQKKRELEMLLQKQREELRLLEEQRLEQRRKMMAEKQRIEFEKQQLALRKQQMELDALRQEQLRQRQILEQQRKQLEEERMRIERQRLAEIEAAKQKAIEQEKRRIREEQQRLKEIELAKQQAAELERKRIEAERRKRAQAELSRRRAAEQERIRLEAERRRLMEERKRQEAAAAAAAKAKAEAEAAAAAAAAAKAEIEARERAAASMVMGPDAGLTLDTAMSQNDTASGNSSFTPIGAVGGQLTDADAATAMAWQAVVKAAQIQASGGNADPNALITQQQEQLQQHQQLVSMLQSGQGLTPEMMKLIGITPEPTTTPAPPTMIPGMAGMDPAALMKLLQEQAAQAVVTTPAPPTTTPKPKRKAPIRPDPNTREFVRNMFIDNMQPGVDPLSILIGLTPEMLMKSGVNPLIANSGDLARIVPAVERALGVSLKKIPVPMGPGGRPLSPQPSGFQTLNIRGSPGGGTSGAQRRDFLMQQRMMTEMMTLLGLGPEPLEPGDPGYRGPGSRTRAGVGPTSPHAGHPQPGMPDIGHAQPGMGHEMGGPGRGMGGQPGGGLRAQMEMLGF